MLRSLTTILAALVGGYSSGAAQESSAARDTAEVSEITGRLRSQPEPVSIDHAVISMEDDWAEVKVPRCAPGIAEDRFRLIRFSRRWRFVSIELDRPPAGTIVGR